jgi:hypothetical protein
LDKYGDFSFENEWKDSTFHIVLNLDSKYIHLYADETIKYDFITTADNYDDDYPICYFKWSALDKRGKKCGIRLQYFKKEGHVDRDAPSYIMIDYKNMIYQYMIKVSD